MRETVSEERPAGPAADAARAAGGAGGAAAGEPPAPPRPRETRAEKIREAAEAILFSSPRPVSERDLASVLEATPEAVREALALLAAETDSPQRGVRLEHVGGGWRFVTRPEFDSLLRRFHEVSERSRLSLAALETLAIIAYRQPITLPEVQEIRGVNSSSVLKTLFEKKLITTAGKKAVVGTPFLYKTTPDFLVRFGLNEIEELPKPEEIEEDLAATVPDDSLPAASRDVLPPPGPDEEDESDGDAMGAGGAPALERGPSAGAPSDEEEGNDDDDDEYDDDLDERIADDPSVRDRK
ncbi:MAG: SMC-Scp complex subunit ScpB [Thermoanaerobaculia bacterium]